MTNTDKCAALIYDAVQNAIEEINNNTSESFMNEDTRDKIAHALQIKFEDMCDSAGIK